MPDAATQQNRPHGTWYSGRHRREQRDRGGDRAAAGRRGLRRGGGRPPPGPARRARRGASRASAPSTSDVTSADSVAELAASLDDVAVLVNNAGGAIGVEPVERADPADWQQMFDTNVLGVLRVTQALLPALERGAGGHVVVTGSIAGHLVYEGGAGYTAAKHGATALVETLRLELNGRPVRVTEVAPGMVHTEEFSLVRLRGDQAAADRVYDGRRPPADRRRHRRLHRLRGHPPAARQHRPARGQAARPGRAAQGRPPLTGLSVRRTSRARSTRRCRAPRRRSPARFRTRRRRRRRERARPSTGRSSPLIWPKSANAISAVKHGEDEPDDRGPEVALTRSPMSSPITATTPAQKMVILPSPASVPLTDRLSPKNWTDAHGATEPITPSNAARQQHPAE